MATWYTSITIMTVWSNYDQGTPGDWLISGMSDEPRGYVFDNYLDAYNMWYTCIDKLIDNAYFDTVSVTSDFTRVLLPAATSDYEDYPWPPDWPVYKVEYDYTQAGPVDGCQFEYLFGMETDILPENWTVEGLRYPNGASCGNDYQGVALAALLTGIDFPDIFQLTYDAKKVFQPQTGEPYPLKYANGVNTVNFLFGVGYSRYGRVQPSKDGGFLCYELDGEDGAIIGNISVFRNDRTLSAVVTADQLFHYLP